MTKVQAKHVILSATLALCTALVACAKPEANRVTKAENPSPSSNPLKAAVDNKKAEESEEDKKASVKVDTDALAKDSAILTDEQKKLLEQRLASLDALTDVLSQDKGAAPVDQNSAAPAKDGGVPAGDGGGAAASTSEKPVTDVSTNTNQAQVGQSLATDAAAPAPVAASSVAPAVSDHVQIVGSKDVTPEQKALVLSLVKPAMIENGAIWKQRVRIEQLAEKYYVKDQTQEEFKFLSDLRKEYGLAEGASFDELMSRVDVVQMGVVIAQMVSAHGWAMQDEKGLQDTKFIYTTMANKIQSLNVSNDEESVRFRQARAAMRKAGSMDSFDLMEAYVGAGPSDRTVNQRKLINLVGIVKIALATEEVQAEVQKVKQQIASQELKLVKAATN